MSAPPRHRELRDKYARFVVLDKRGRIVGHESRVAGPIPLPPGTARLVTLGRLKKERRTSSG